MPIPAAAAALASSIPAAAPVIGGALVSFAIIANHDPGKLESALLTGKPEAAAECVARNVASMQTRLAAAVQPLNGTQVMGVIVKDGPVGAPLMNIVIQESGTGSNAEFRPLTPPEEQPDIITKIIAGCRAGR